MKTRTGGVSCGCRDLSPSGETHSWCSHCGCPCGCGISRDALGMTIHGGLSSGGEREALDGASHHRLGGDAGGRLRPPGGGGVGPGPQFLSALGTRSVSIPRALGSP